jgi:hypothetical protein
MKALLVIFLPALSLFAETTERPVAAPAPDYDVKRASSKITVDGRLEEEAWKAAGVIALQFPWEEQTGAKQQTTVRLLWDDECLYVAFECVDTDIVAHFGERDDPTYKDDAVEIFLNPNPERKNYVGMEMNARAVLYDYLNNFPNGIRKSYDLKGVRLAAHLDGTLNTSTDTDKGWALEVAIPLSNFAKCMRGKSVGAGTVWSAGLNRWDGTEPHRRLSMWSDSGLFHPSPHNPSRFGRLHFVK